MAVNNFAGHRFHFLVPHGLADLKFFVKAPRTLFRAERSVCHDLSLNESAAGHTGWLFISTLYYCGKREPQ